MSLSKTEAKQLLERLVFEGDRPDDWTQDVWGLSPTLGETAARLVDAFNALVDCCPDETLENLVQGLYRQKSDRDINYRDMNHRGTEDTKR